MFGRIGQSRVERSNLIQRYRSRSRNAYQTFHRQDIGYQESTWSSYFRATSSEEERVTIVTERLKDLAIDAGIPVHPGPDALRYAQDKLAMRERLTGAGIARIAFAAVEHLHEANRCRALFATHFHELTALSKRLPRLDNATLKVAEHRGDVVFLHEVVPGEWRLMVFQGDRKLAERTFQVRSR